MPASIHLIEMPSSPPATGAPWRRWFTSEALDLIVWLDAAGAPQAFQLCYGKPLQERALEWKPACGFRHLSVDDGSLDVQGHKRTPVMANDRTADATNLLQQLEGAGNDLPPAILVFVRARLLELQEAAHE